MEISWRNIFSIEQLIRKEATDVLFWRHCSKRLFFSTAGKLNWLAPWHQFADTSRLVVAKWISWCPNMTSQYSKMSKHVSLWWEIIRTLCRHFFCQAKPGANLSRFAVLGHSWRAMTIRVEVCVCMLKGTYHRTYRKWEKDDSVGAGSHADSVHLKPSTENTTKVMLGWSCVFLKGDNMTEAPTRVCGFFGHIWIANALFFSFFFFFSRRLV